MDIEDGVWRNLVFTFDGVSTHNGGNGIVNGVGGTGHDQWGWEFWRRTKSAYGTVVVNGEKFKHPTPISLEWRPDKMVAKYEIGNTTITEEKFIRSDDLGDLSFDPQKDLKWYC